MCRFFSPFAMKNGCHFHGGWFPSLRWTSRRGWRIGRPSPGSVRLGWNGETEAILDGEKVFGSSRWKMIPVEILLWWLAAASSISKQLMLGKFDTKHIQKLVNNVRYIYLYIYTYMCPKHDANVGRHISRIFPVDFTWQQLISSQLPGYYLGLNTCPSCAPRTFAWNNIRCHLQR